jgi:hypothetical protein
MANVCRPGARKVRVRNRVALPSVSRLLWLQQHLFSRDNVMQHHCELPSGKISPRGVTGVDTTIVADHRRGGQSAGDRLLQVRQLFCR